MNKLFTAFGCLLGCTASFISAQPGTYLGPGILSRGAGEIGSRSGQQVDLRFFADVSGTYDTGLQPFEVDSRGDLVRVSGLYGVQLDLGAYGTHRWRQALLGLDYSGDFIHYTNASHFDSSSHNLRLGYTYQKSRRLAIDAREIAGTSVFSYGSPGFYGSSQSQAPTDFVTSPTALLFDNRFYYFQSTMDVNFIQSARTIYTIGADGFWVRRHASGLANTNGYNFRGTVQHRLNKRQTVGAVYQHSHFDFPPAFGQSDIDTAELFFATGVGRRWNFSLSAGAVSAQVQGIEQVAIDPVIAALLGASFSERAFYSHSIAPSGRAGLTGNFKSSQISFNYSQQVTPGNGVYLTSLQRWGGANYTYTGIRNWSLSLGAGYSSLKGVGQVIQPYSNYTASAGVTYRISGALHAIARFDARDQQISVVGYKNTGYHATIGLGFSPGDLPLSLW